MPWDSSLSLISVTSSPLRVSFTRLHSTLILTCSSRRNVVWHVSQCTWQGNQRARARIGSRWRPHHLKRPANDSTQDIAVLKRLAPFWQLYKVNQQVIVQYLQVNGWEVSRCPKGDSRQA